MIGALFISAGIGYFYSIPFASILQGCHYRIKECFYRSRKYILISLSYFLILCGVIIAVEMRWQSLWRYLLYCSFYLLTALLLFVVKKRIGIALNVTNRLVRLLVSSTILYLLLFFGLFFSKGRHLWAITPALSPLVLALAAFLIGPFERKNNRKYIMRAEMRIKRSNAIKIGITGSYGKTTVKNDLDRLLSLRFDTLSTPANYNTPLGIARCMEQATGKEEVLIFEMGARRIGDIKELCEMTSPQIGIITGIAPQHLETFGSLEAIVKEKGCLAEAIPQTGMMFFNVCDKIVRDMYDAFSGQKIAVGKEDADYILSDVTYCDEGMSFTLAGRGKEEHFLLGQWGDGAVIDFALAAAVAWELGVDPQLTVEKARGLVSSSHRFSVRKEGDIVIVDDSYNINPIGASVALDSLRAIPGKRRVVYTSGMVELGKEEKTLNRELGEKISDVADLVVVGGGKYGEWVKEGLFAKGFAADAIYPVPDTKEASVIFREILRPGDVLLIMSDLPKDYLL